MGNKAEQAIAKIMSKVSGVGNDIKIEGSTMSYNAVSESAVLKALRPLFIEEGLIYYPVEGTLSSSGSVSFIGVTLKIVHVESGDSMTIWSAGGGKDSQDKGPGKALTYATKYGLLKTLMLRGEDDPDTTSSEELTKREAELKLLYEEAKNKLDPILEDKKITKAQYDFVINNLNEAYNDRDAVKRLKGAGVWIEKLAKGEVKIEINGES
jgi:hypothetical protein